MTTDHDHDLQTDHGWDNRRLILASLAPRTTTRPARRGAGPTVVDEAPDDAATPKKPGLLTRGLHASGRAARAGSRQFNRRVPPNRRMRAAIITAAAVVVLLVALAGVNYLTSDINPQAGTTTPTAAPPQPPTQLAISITMSAVVTLLFIVASCNRGSSSYTPLCINLAETICTNR